VKLSPAASEGSGTLNYTLRYPPGAEVKAFTLTRLAETIPVDLTGGAPVTDNPFAGTRGTASGYYLALASLTKNSISAEKTEVVHVYKNMTTELELEFDDPDFTAFLVTSSADSGPGTLRQALADAPKGTTILIDLPEHDRVITLTTGRLEVNGKHTIEGNGVTITQNGAFNDSLMRVTGGNNDYVEVHRIHFKGGGAANGAAIYNEGAKLFVESCIFSGNRASARGGAIYDDHSSGTVSLSSLALRGCTFFGNSAGVEGGAVYFTGAKATLVQAGNVFWGNTAPAYPGYIIATGTGGNGNPELGSLPVSPVSFRPLKDSPALYIIATRPVAYPETDFYGAPIPAENAAAGAVQTPVQGDGFVLDYAAIGSGEVAITSGAIDADGLVSGGVTLTASNGAFAYWIIDGVKDTENLSPVRIIPNMDGHKTVRAFFHLVVTSDASDGPGSLREALAIAGPGDTIVLTAGQTIVLTNLLQINKSIIIDGNGATLTQRGVLSASGGLLSITSSATVSIRRLHFTGGRATSNGGAVYNQGNLTLESCIFSDNANSTTNTNNGGGAVYTNGASAVLTVKGCTFYGNSTGGYGGAILKSNGSISLTGNVFWGNTAASYPVVRVGTGSAVTTGGFNVSDKATGTNTAQSGWTFRAVVGEQDKNVSSLPFSFAGFRPITGLGLEGVIGTRPTGYPETDFYGDPIPASGAAAGAAQIPVAGTGNILNYGYIGPGTVTVTTGTVDINGFTADASVTLTAEPSGNGKFERWTDGTQELGQSATLTVTMDGHKTVRAVFSMVYTVTSPLDSGTGSLREALTNATAGDTIVLPANQTITLNSPLPRISKSMVIEGNGATLTQSGITPSDSSQLLYISGTTTVVRISRLLFKGGRATDYGGAIYFANGNLTLESCIFHDNATTSTSYGGGAVYTSGALTVSGCTFFGNTATTRGGAIFRPSGTLTLTGNVFRDNAAASYPVVYMSSGSVVSGGFNVSDRDTGAANSGWTFDGDKWAMLLPVSSVSFRPIGGLDSANTVVGIINEILVGYPEKDFYGVELSLPGAAAGAVQTPVTGTGWVLDYAASGPGEVSAAGGTVNDDGLINAGSSITLTAAPLSNGVFEGWTVNGAAHGEQSSTLNLSMDGHKIVRAVFSYSLTVTSVLDSGPGTLREVLTHAYDGGTVVLPEGQTIILSSLLPQITKSIIIEGNGATLTQGGFTPNNTSQLLYINSTTAVVRISRLHFKRGVATDYGAAIQNNGGKLTLESCIFSENQTTSSFGWGGAVLTQGSAPTLTVSGCTFYGNTAGTTSGSGGAIYRQGGTLTLVGNIFWANTANTYPVVGGGSSSTTTNGYNVSDKEGGAGAALSGWVFNTDPNSKDAYLTNLGFLDFKPYSTELPEIPLPLSGFPSTYFDGTPRGTSSTPGAMPADVYEADPDPGPPPEAPPAKPQDYSTPPSQPAGLKSVPGMKLVHLSWFPAARAESYEVYYSQGTDLNAATKWSEEPAEPETIVTGLEYSTVYHFWVKAKNQSGERLGNMFTMPRRTSDPLPWQFIYRAPAETKFLPDNAAGDWYAFYDLGPGTVPDERYRITYGGSGDIKYVDTQVGVIIYRQDGVDSSGNPNGKFQATYGAKPTDIFPYKASLGQANGYTSQMGNDQRTTTLEEAIEKFALQGGPGIKGGPYEFITGMALAYVLVGPEITE
jgi:predicted outer membrane repeat protein